MKIIADRSMTNLPYDVYWQDTLYNCPAMPLFLRVYSEIIEKDFAASNITWKNKSNMIWAQDGDAILGGICYEYYPEFLTGYAILVFTDPEHRRTGIATALWDWFERDIRRLGGQGVALNIHVTNQNMIKFCESLEMKHVYVNMSKRIGIKEQK